MATFFAKYPKLLVNNRLVTDILARTSIREKYSDKLSIFYPYTLQEGDTPEIIAEKYYGDPEKHWIVLLANNIIDPFFEFPFDYPSFERYLNEKYKSEGESLIPSRTGYEFAQITTNINPPGYRAVFTTTDTISGESTTEKIWIDKMAFDGNYPNANNSVDMSNQVSGRFNYADMTNHIENVIYTQTTEQLTIYDYEMELNDDKREIQLIREEYASQLDKELKLLMRKQ